ncbi:MAG: DUF6472 family protein [Clostridia bacterium]|nr:DUF6472 family protein [Clostridia bacterium]
MKEKKICGVCEDCEYFDYPIDDEIGDKICCAEMDEDELVKFLTDRSAGCPFFKPYDEYKLVAKQN